jgi:nucleotide-binding universal stress UspA family protein
VGPEVEKLTSLLVVVPEGGASGVLFDKMCRLVKQVGARVELFLTAPSDYAAVMARRATMSCDAEVGITLHDNLNPMAEAILDRAAELRADLLVAPRAQFSLPHCPIPLLLLGKRPWEREPRFATAVDVAERDSESLARSILHVSGFLALQLQAHLDILYSERELDDEATRMERAVRLARLVREYRIGVERLQVFDGMPQQTLPALIAARQYDVLILGTVPRHLALLSAFQSVSRKLIHSTDGDVLLVPPAPEREAVPRPLSAGQQLAHQP